MDFPHGFMASRLGDTSRDYEEWKWHVAKVRELPEYKLRKLWKMNFSPKDIAADKHWEVYPPVGVRRKKVAPGTPQETKRGRTLGAKKKNWIYARALKEAAQGILDFYRLDSIMLGEVRRELAQFTELTKTYSHKPAKET